MANYLPYYLAFAAVFGLFWGFALRGQRKVREATGPTRAGDVARALGMTIVVGDPMFDIASGAPSAGLLGWLLSTTPLPYSGPATEIIARGELGGRPTELYFYAKLRAGWRLGGLMAREIEIARHCRLAVSQRVPTGDFELVLRHHPSGADTARALPMLPPVPFGTPRLDERYELSAAAPGVAYRLSRALGVFDDQAHVHLVGQGGRVALSFAPAATFEFAGAPRAFLQKLDAFVGALDAQP
ncbi:MAG TPA: hypothetical protein VK550_21175 [Polyangiaceae bacterium]|nr:hypothetical protein [Polyangiaceae bacterium]